MIRQRFSGQIAGLGTRSGTRLVIGTWQDSPFGSFTDVMIERADGHRVLVAPTAQVRDFVAETYTFDETRIEPIDLQRNDSRWLLCADSLSLSLTIGGRRPLGWALRGIPRPLATSTAWASAVDPIARVVLRGVRTRGVARPGRREWYAATDLRAITSASGRLDGEPLGDLRPVDPPCHFGFSSTPRAPGVTTVVTTVEST